MGGSSTWSLMTTVVDTCRCLPWFQPAGAVPAAALQVPPVCPVHPRAPAVHVHQVHQPLPGD